MQLLAAFPVHGHKARRFQNREVLTRRLAAHLQIRGQLAQRQSGMRKQTIHQLPAGRVGQRSEYQVESIATHATYRLHETIREGVGSRQARSRSGIAFRDLDIVFEILRPHFALPDYIFAAFADLRRR